ncbi:LysR substrate-binding domain-containing protein (plasmid) [Pantoea anthophila]|uniref:LysR substrate-binding domain-containing protein n=1 Tax=Pantoea anthophila TaxID=470931 RepID=UPI002236B57F|nr:LysR substrate-binding domain-containing protein [Pantoea anthophila]UZH01124.1 LysR substrate-binding domain-containing protein [Pantoea anthophila]
MNKVPECLDMDALRSFVAGIDAGSFASAAQHLCRSTSAISAQLKKLEQQCGTALVMKKGRHLQLTRSGEQMMSYARRLLSLNDETLRAVRGEALQGEIRIGMQEDFGEALMPAILGAFNRQHPEVMLTARVDRNLPLLTALARHELDLALLWQAEPQAGTPLIGQCPLAWIYHPDIDLAGMLQRGEPLPLVVFDAPCVMRSRAIDALDAAAIPWRVVFTSHSLSGIWAALQAGLGVTLRTRAGMPDRLVTESQRLPPLGTLGIALARADRGEDPARTLLQQLIAEAALPFVQR